MKTIKDIKDLKNKKVLIRVDFNCPIKDGRVTNDFRIKKSLKTIKYLVQKGAKIILISHLGRPKGKVDKKFSLKPVYKALKKYFPKAYFINDCIGKKVDKKISKLKSGDVLLLENLRFYHGEKENDLNFAKKLAQGKDLFVNDAFGVSHRKHASIYGILNYIPGFAGMLLYEEVKNLNQVLKTEKYPFIVLMGGVKASTKIKTIESLLKRADKVLLAGGIANTFLKAKGKDIKDSFYEPDMVEKAKELLETGKIILPQDFKESKKGKTEFLDIGEKTILDFSSILKNAKMIIWNGPLGYFEKTDFAHGTEEIANIILNNKKAQVLIGGGDTVAAIFKLTKYDEDNYKNIFISTGGGSLLKFLSNKNLPSIDKLSK